MCFSGDSDSGSGGDFDSGCGGGGEEDLDDVFLLGIM
jgi:hypothetical protein